MRSASGNLIGSPLVEFNTEPMQTAIYLLRRFQYNFFQLYCFLSRLRQIEFPGTGKFYLLTLNFDTGLYISLQLNIIFVFFNLSGDLRANDYICFNLHQGLLETKADDLEIQLPIFSANGLFFQSHCHCSQRQMSFISR